MTDIIHESVQKIRDILEHGGCGDGDVLLDVNPNARNCQFERGACMTASFGGRSADFVTFDPIRARTKIAFMYNAPLDTPSTRAAALVIVNVVTGFFCLSRVLHACPEQAHASCLSELKQEIGGRTICCIGNIPEIGLHFSRQIVKDPETADIILIGCDGIVETVTGEVIAKFKGKKPVLCIGPSIAGICRTHQLEHWCPYGRSA